MKIEETAKPSPDLFQKELNLPKIEHYSLNLPEKVVNTKDE